MHVGSLFSGIGGIELALESLGMRTAWQVECDPYARNVLWQHWPYVPKYDDVRAVGASNLSRVDVICGGFPCQGISNAGRRAGLADPRSGLWREFARIVRELRPQYVFVENVAALRVRGLGRVLGDLAEIGYDAEWDCLRAADVGAPHLRARFFLLAYAVRDRVRPEFRRTQPGAAPAFAGDDGAHRRMADTDLPRFEGAGAIGGGPEDAGIESRRQDVADTDRSGLAQFSSADTARSGGDARRDESSGCGSHLAHSESDGWDEGRSTSAGQFRRSHVTECCRTVADAARERFFQRRRFERSQEREGKWLVDWWETEPDVGRVVARSPARVHRLRCLGNAVVPEQAALAWSTLLTRASVRVALGSNSG